MIARGTKEQKPPFSGFSASVPWGLFKSIWYFFCVVLGTRLEAVITDTIKTPFFAFGIIYLFWPSDDAYFLLHQSKRYSILFLLRT